MASLAGATTNLRSDAPVSSPLAGSPCEDCPPKSHRPAPRPPRAYLTRSPGMVQAATLLGTFHLASELVQGLSLTFVPGHLPLLPAQKRTRSIPKPANPERALDPPRSQTSAPAPPTKLTPNTRPGPPRLTPQKCEPITAPPAQSGTAPTVYRTTLGIHGARTIRDDGRTIQRTRGHTRGPESGRPRCTGRARARWDPRKSPGVGVDTSRGLQEPGPAEGAGVVGASPFGKVELALARLNVNLALGMSTWVLPAGPGDVPAMGRGGGSKARLGVSARPRPWSWPWKEGDKGGTPRRCPPLLFLFFFQLPQTATPSRYPTSLSLAALAYIATAYIHLVLSSPLHPHPSLHPRPRRDACRRQQPPPQGSPRYAVPCSILTLSSSTPLTFLSLVHCSHSQRAQTRRTHLPPLARVHQPMRAHRPP